MIIKGEIDTKELKEIVSKYIESITGMNIPENELKIEVKSKQNYKSEWEDAEFRATFNSRIL